MTINIEATIQQFGYKPSDLSKGSHKPIYLVCDYCKIIYVVEYKTTFRHKEYTNKDSCKKCCYLKVQETSQKKYGVKHHISHPDIQNKIKRTCLKKYGQSYPITEVNRKLGQKAILKKYGVNSVGKIPEIASKISKTMRSQGTKLKKEQTCLKKYGVKYPSQKPEIYQKSLNTKIKKYGRINFTSKRTERSIQNYLDSLGYNFKSNHSILNGKEIDFFDESLKLGIEFCGLYWHTEKSPQPRLKYYHWNKYQKCLDKNIRLITIFSDEWANCNKQVKGYLKAILHKNKKIYARNCILKELDWPTNKEFLYNNHILGSGSTKLISFGLFYNNDLVGSISIRKHHRQNIKENVLVIDRICFTSGITIVGGASRLLKLCIKFVKNKGYKNIITWSDNRYSQGNLYTKLGFDCQKEYGPDYSYVNMSNPKKRQSKQSMKKKDIGCPSHVKEADYAWKNYNMARIWDCGKKKFILEINSEI